MSKKYSLNEVVEFQNGGAWTQDCYAESGIPVVRVSDIHDGTVVLNNCKYLPNDLLNKYRKHTLKEGDLVICTVGSHPTQPGSVVGRSATVPSAANNALLNQNAVRLRPSVDYLDEKYLAFLGKSDRMRQYIISNARGSANQVRISISALKNYEIDLPDIRIQHEIASTLSAFDDLIENNIRRIQILEEMARLIYKEWFVHFRYPGHESVPLVDSPLGNIPEGWEVKNFDSIADVLSGGTPKTSVYEYWDGDIPFFTPKDATSSFFVHQTEKTVSEDGINHCSSKMYPPRTVFITARGTVGKLNMPMVPMAMNQSCYALRSKNGLGQYFIYFSLENLVQTLQQRAHGAVFDTIIKDTFKQIFTIVPPINLAKRFDELIEPILNEVQILLKKNKILKEIRDLLLPKLISGKVNLDKVINN